MPQTGRVAAIISILLLFLAIIERWPYGFYTFLRIVVCVSALYLAFQAHKIHKPFSTWVLGGVAVLFNPFVPIYMQRTQWRWFDFLGLVVFVASLGVVRARRSELNGTSG